MQQLTAGGFACAAVAAACRSHELDRCGTLRWRLPWWWWIRRRRFRWISRWWVRRRRLHDLAAEDLSGRGSVMADFSTAAAMQALAEAALAASATAVSFADREQRLPNRTIPSIDARQLQQNRFNEANTLQQNRFSEANNLQYNHENNWNYWRGHWGGYYAGLGLGAGFAIGATFCGATGRRRRAFCRQRAVLVRQRRLLRDAEWAIRHRAAAAWSHCRNTSVLVLDCLCRHQHASRLRWGVL